ncbi:hypothetical protein FEM48_Zijuj05G0066900 [Ziziphus jujuba var. spinosa]|uniref:Cytochrome P450 71A1-like n=1 Tax=Ziziphus jujuba var. spinosa TaxID=714518 RepID=A0A978VDE7_ZIZJJ|nr:hypothetical protein FEM48_Zijuj05G0066900 [Ziziphus jujuba var. spinosa]
MDPLTALLQQWWLELQSTTFFKPIIFFPLLIFFSVYLYKLIITGPKLNLPPSPPKLPIIGNIHQLSTQLHRSFQDLSEKYGPLILLHLGRSPILIVSSADIAKEILKSHDSVFLNRPRVRAADVLLYGCTDVAFCPYGEYWRQTKRIHVLELLSLKRVQGFQFVRQEEVAEMVEKIRYRCEDGGEVDLSEMLTTISNSIASRCALGRKFEGEDGDESFGALSKKALELTGAFNFRDSIPFLKFMDGLTGFDAKLKKTAKAFHDLLDQVIDEHQKSYNYDQQQSDNKKDFVDILLHLQKGGELGINLTRENLVAILLTEYVLANLLYWFDWKLPNGATVEDFDMSDVFGLVIHKKIPLRLSEGTVGRNFTLLGRNIMVYLLAFC